MLKFMNTPEKIFPFAAQEGRLVLLGLYLEVGSCIAVENTRLLR